MVSKGVKSAVYRNIISNSEPENEGITSASNINVGETTGIDWDTILTPSILSEELEVEALKTLFPKIFPSRLVGTLTLRQLRENIKVNNAKSAHPEAITDSELNLAIYQVYNQYKTHIELRNMIKKKETKTRENVGKVIGMITLPQISGDEGGSTSEADAKEQKISMMTVLAISCACTVLVGLLVVASLVKAKMKTREEGEYDALDEDAENQS